MCEHSGILALTRKKGTDGDDSATKEYHVPNFEDFSILATNKKRL